MEALTHDSAPFVRTPKSFAHTLSPFPPQEELVQTFQRISAVVLFPLEVGAGWLLLPRRESVAVH
jgi:hypothetical protein